MSGELGERTSARELSYGEDGEDGGGLLERALGVPSLPPRSYSTAVNVEKSRNLNLVRRRFLDEAALAGADFYYGWGAGKNRIEGPTIKLAMALARCWGNNAVEMLPVQDLGDSWVFTAAFVDLETGFTMSRQFRMSKNYPVAGKHDPERKADMRFQIGQSKATRNVILNALPGSIVEDGIERAKDGVKSRIEEYIAKKGKPAAVDYLLAALAKSAVTEAAVLHRFGKATKDGLEIDELVILNGDLGAIQGGQERPEVLFPPPPDAGGKDALEQLRQKVAAMTPPAAPPQPEAQAGKDASRKQLQRLGKETERLRMTAADLDAALAPFNAATLAELTAEQADGLLTRWTHLPAPAAKREPGEEG